MTMLLTKTLPLLIKIYRFNKKSHVYMQNNEQIMNLLLTI